MYAGKHPPSFLHCWILIPLQTQADITGIPVNRPAMREATSLGAAIAAGFAVDTQEEVIELKQIKLQGRDIFTPHTSKEERSKMYRRWERAVEMSRGWLADNNAPK